MKDYPVLITGTLYAACLGCAALMYFGNLIFNLAVIASLGAFLWCLARRS